MHLDTKLLEATSIYDLFMGYKPEVHTPEWAILNLSLMLLRLESEQQFKARHEIIQYGIESLN